MGYYSEDRQYYSGNYNQNFSDDMSEDGYSDGYSDGYNDGNGYNNGYNDGYDSDEYESSDGEEPPRSYNCPVSQDQFYSEIENYLKQIRKDESSRLGFSLKGRSLEKHMDRVYSRNQVLFCVDVEAWEHDHDKITEIGIAIYDPHDQELSLSPHIKKFHMIISENKHLRNGKYVPDNKDNFLGGPSWHFTLGEARVFVQRLIDHYFDRDFPMHCALVGHDLKGDLNWLNQLGVQMPYCIRKLDTKVVFAYTHGHDGASLKNALDAAQQPYSFLHNAGNDAYFTIMLALKLCDPGSRHLSGLEYYSGEDINNKSKETLFRSMLSTYD